MTNVFLVCLGSLIVTVPSGDEPKDATAYNARGLMYLGASEFEKAVRDFTSAIKLDSKYAEAHLNRAKAYYKLRGWGRSIPQYYAAILRFCLWQR